MGHTLYSFCRPKDHRRDCRDHLCLHTHFPDETFEDQRAKSLAQSLLPSSSIAELLAPCQCPHTHPTTSLKLAEAIVFSPALCTWGGGHRHLTSLQLWLSSHVPQIGGRWSEPRR